MNRLNLSEAQSLAHEIYGLDAVARPLDGEMDATLNYWNFCAVLEAKGFRRLAGIEDLLPKLGAKGRTAMLGYVFDEKWAAANQDQLARFIAVTRKAKEILASSDAEWETIAPLTGAPDAATLRVYRDRYREGIPRRSIADEEADARILYRVLADIGRYESVLIQNKARREADLADRVVRRLEGVIIARSWSLLEYNLPREKLAEAEKVTPGFDSPTVNALEDPAWCAVRVMVRRSEVIGVMERLEALGAHAILETQINNCRL